MENPLQIAICEDSDADADWLKSCALRCGMPALCERFESGEALLASFQTGRYDLVFMDIYMNGLRGVEVVRAIRETDENVVVAFTTSSPGHTLESYRLGALKYMEKPVKEKDVKEAMELALHKRRSRASVTLLIGGRHTDIPLDSIHYFEQCDHAVKVHTSGGVLMTSQTVRMDAIERQLPSPPFYRCHHSFIVNMRYVRIVDDEFGSFVMKNGERAHIRHSAVKKMKSAFEDYKYAAARRGSGDV